MASTGIDVDECGRVWVIESNTHFLSEVYRRAITLKASLVPEKLSEKLTRLEMRDLIAYYQTLKSN